MQTGSEFPQNSLVFYYIGAAARAGPSAGYYTIKKEKQLVALNKQNVDLAKLSAQHPDTAETLQNPKSANCAG